MFAIQYTPFAYFYHIKIPLIESEVVSLVWFVSLSKLPWVIPTQLSVTSDTPIYV